MGDPRDPDALVYDDDVVAMAMDPRTGGRRVREWARPPLARRRRRVGTRRTGGGGGEPEDSPCTYDHRSPSEDPSTWSQSMTTTVDGSMRWYHHDPSSTTRKTPPALHRNVPPDRLTSSPRLRSTTCSPITRRAFSTPSVSSSWLSSLRPWRLSRWMLVAAVTTLAHVLSSLVVVVVVVSSWSIETPGGGIRPAVRRYHPSLAKTTDMAPRHQLLRGFVGPDARWSPPMSLRVAPTVHHRSRPRRHHHATTTTAAADGAVVSESVTHRVGTHAWQQVSWLARLASSTSASPSSSFFRQRGNRLRYGFADDDDDGVNQNSHSATEDRTANHRDPRRTGGHQIHHAGGRPTSKADTSSTGADRNSSTATSVATASSSLSSSPPQQRQVSMALKTLEQDMQLLDTLAGERTQLSALEFTLLAGAVACAATSPLLFAGKISEFLAPAAAALTAAIGIGAEYAGKVAVADGKEVAAATIQCAAEAEAFLANAERAKAVTPLCAGIAATSATFALLVPVLLDSFGMANSNLQVVTEIYLCCPLIAVLAAAVAALALQETRSFTQRAIGVGNRRFARSGLVGRTWLSTTELVRRKSTGTASKWRTFSLSVLPAPIIGSFVPGSLPTKTIVVAALAAAECAFFLAQSEAVVARASDAVALKARSAAVCDTYANQGARSAAILPFTSALSSLCAAATAAIVELPFFESLTAMGTSQSLVAQMVMVSFFPALSAMFAAAASVSKARCELDAEAAMQAATTLALEYSEGEEDPVLRPFRAVQELIRLTLRNSVKEPFLRYFRNSPLIGPWRTIKRWYRQSVQRRG